MAIYHMSAQIIGRSAGRSAIAAAAYRAGEKIVDERTGEVHDYTRKHGVDYQEILTPEGAGDWARNRTTLWNHAEQSETRRNSQIAREINIAIPKELDPEKGRELVRDYAQRNFVNQGMIADICIHHEESENPHAHIMLSMREAGPDGFTNKNRDWNDKSQLEAWREDWAHSCNKMLEREGMNISIDHRTLEAQGIDREPTKHLGPAVTQMERRGIESDIGNINREIAERQIEIERLQKAISFINQAIEQIQKEPDEIKPKTVEKEQETATEKKSKTTTQKAQREYNEQTTKRILEYIQNEPDINKVKQLYFLVQSDAIKKDLEAEIKKQFDYHQAEQKVSTNQEAFDSAAYSEKRIAVEIDNLGVLDRAKYKLGKHEINHREKEITERKERAHTELMKSRREFDEVKNQLSSPTSEVYQEVYTHNKNTEEAAKAYHILTAHYNERIKQEVEKQQEATRKRDKDGHER